MGAAFSKLANLKPPKALKAVKPIKIKALTVGKAPKVSDKWGTEIGQEERRLTGVTRKLTGAYQESPARFLPKSRELSVKALRAGGLRQMAGL